MRNFALEQAALGRAVRYQHTDAPYAAVLREVTRDLGPLLFMRPAGRELREELRPLVQAGLLEEVAHEGWLTTSDDFLRGAGVEPPCRIECFYRHVHALTDALSHPALGARELAPSAAPRPRGERPLLRSSPREPRGPHPAGARLAGVRAPRARADGRPPALAERPGPLGGRRWRWRLRPLAPKRLGLFRRRRGSGPKRPRPAQGFAAGFLGKGEQVSLPRPRGAGRVDGRLQPPHHAPDGARQHRLPARRRASGTLRRLGGGAERPRHGQLRHGRPHDHQALRGGGGLHQLHERLLRGLPLLDEALSPHTAVLGLSRAPRRHPRGRAPQEAPAAWTGSAQPRGAGSRQAGVRASDYAPRRGERRHSRGHRRERRSAIGSLQPRGGIKET
jgi:hypothetical protein